MRAINILAFVFLTIVLSTNVYSFGGNFGASGGAGDMKTSTYDSEPDGVIDDGAIPSTITRDVELETALSGYVLSSALTTTLSDYVLSSALATTLVDYVLTSALATAEVRTAKELSPTKESGVPGYSYWFEADTTNELTSGFQGADDQTVNISYKFPDAAGTNEQVLIGGTPLTSQTLPDGRTGTIVPLSWGDMTGGGAPSFVTSDPSVTDTSGIYINTTDGDMFAVNQNTGISTWTTTYTPWWLLTVQDPGNGNSITSSGSIDCPGTCSEYVVNNATPTLTMVETAGYEPLSWTGDNTDTSATTNPDTITMDSAKTVGATFNLLPTLDSGAVMSVSNQITLPFTEALTIGLGGSGGVVVTGSVTGASNGTYLSGDTTAEFTFLTADNFDPAETITVAYTQPTDGLEDSDGGDLASFSGESVANSIGGGGSTPVARWLFENDLTDSIASYDLTGAGTIAYSTTTPPEGTYSLELATGGTDYAYISDNAAFEPGSGSFTFGGWAYMDWSIANGYLGGKYTTAGDQREFYLSNSGSRSIVFALCSDGVTATTFSQTYALPNETSWKHIVGVYDADADTVNVYIDGVALSAGDFPASHSAAIYDGTGPLTIGAISAGGADGLYDDWRYYHVALGSTAILAWYNETD